jgi:hypothetical protein
MQILSPHQYTMLSPESQRLYILGLPTNELLKFTETLNKWLKKSAKDADIYCMFGQSSTTDNVRFNLTMLKKSKDDTLVDVIARYPQLKTIPSVMNMVREDFQRFLTPRRAR